jgi:hypothetical protein
VVSCQAGDYLAAASAETRDELLETAQNVCDVLVYQWPIVVLMAELIQP